MAPLALLITDLFFRTTVVEPTGPRGFVFYGAQLDDVEREDLIRPMDTEQLGKVHERKVKEEAELKMATAFSTDDLVVVPIYQPGDEEKAENTHHLPFRIKHVRPLDVL